MRAAASSCSAPTAAKQLLPSKTDRVKVEPGDLLVYETWGGGGCGDPFEREPAKVAFDVEAGLVSEEGARRYGVVLKNGRVDGDGDESAARADGARSAARRRSSTAAFSDIAELKSRCKAETGLEPPAAPQFQARTRQAHHGAGAGGAR